MPSSNHLLFLATGSNFKSVFFFLTNCFLRVSVIAVKHHDHEKLGEKWVVSFIVYSPLSKKVRAGTQDKNLEAGTEAEATKETCLLSCSACLLILPRTTSPEMPLFTMS